MEEQLLINHQSRQVQLNLAIAYNQLQEEHKEQQKLLINYKTKAHYWETQFKQLDEKRLILLDEIAELKAQLLKREQQIFGRKSEKGTSKQDINSKATKDKRSRGHQKGEPGHGRRNYSHLPIVEETHELSEEAKKCAKCGLEYKEFGTTEDSNIIEIINVKAYVRKIHRKKYKCSCNCEGNSKLLDAPIAPRVFAKSHYGVSIWSYLLLQKYEYQTPINRVLKQLSSNGLNLAVGTVTEGLNKLLPLLLPLYDKVVNHSLLEKHWHADETGWKVFEEVEGKKNNRWYMWLFQGKETVVYKICKSRSSNELQAHFGEQHPGGLLSVDRYSAYKAIAKEGLFILAFCWAHVRRDFLSYAKGYPHEESWALSWVDDIAKLYHINNQRIQYRQKSKTFNQYQRKLQNAINTMRERIEDELNDKNKLLPSAKKLIISLDNHWSGLTIFVDTPDIPMDNNKAENGLRHGVIGRNNYYGSGAIWSSVLTAVMFTLLRTLALWKLNSHTWLLAYLHDCACHGGKPPQNMDKFLPWNMSETQKKLFSEPPIGEDSS